MAYWLKSAGTTEEPIRHVDASKIWPTANFPANRRPRDMRRGDKLIYYAVGSAQLTGKGRIIVIAEVTSAGPERSDHPRWPWKVDVAVRALAPILSRAPTLDDIGIELKSVRRQSHIRLSDEQGERAERLIERAQSGGAQAG